MWEENVKEQSFCSEGWDGNANVSEVCSQTMQQRQVNSAMSDPTSMFSRMAQQTRPKLSRA